MSDQAPRPGSTGTASAQQEAGQADKGVFENARGTAVKLLSRYESSDSFIDKLLEGELRRSELSPADKALVTELVNGTVRWQSRLDWILTGFYHGEFTKCLPLVRNAMRIALYQMLFLSKIPPPAAINESVDLVKRVKGDRHAGIVNGVLRNILRNITSIRYPAKDDNVVLYDSIVYAHPQWMVRRYHERFGAQAAEQLLQANNQRPMLTLRVNTLTTNKETVERELQEADIKYEQSPIHDNSLLINSLREIRNLPLFEAGHVSVQDASASLAIQLADPKPGMTVYDLCAAPGGKAMYAAERMQNKGQIVALEMYESKLRFISENAERCKVSIVKPVHGDAREFTPDHEADLVLVDAPCTGLGTVSKKPDVKWRRTLDDVRRMSAKQKEILQHAALLVKKGGVLVYSTCTIEPEENGEVVRWFLQQHPEFELDDAAKYVNESVVLDGFVQTFQHRHRSDGAFAARLVRRS
ncbi:MAG: 16S rRNA (cytosine(967)-C(5))-methyltransferase RsmB [Candidatus Kapabacteria bacterium]|nr:16S rRNA (cytosine(967)-C(5))-methyltransferase RsmB [Candidatus Kapabacteria bacterium]